MIKNLKGRARQVAGILTGDTELEDEGAKERAEGNVQESLGKARRKVGAFLHGIADSIDD